jgi:hypothetical protein
VAVCEVVAVLHGDDRRDSASLRELARIHVREADVPDLPLPLELGESADRLLDRDARIDRVQLVEVDPVDAQPVQARLA